MSTQHRSAWSEWAWHEEHKKWGRYCLSNGVYEYEWRDPEPSTSSTSKSEEQKQLWEINDVILNNNYSSQNTAYGPYYSLMTSRVDLPAGFYASERDDAIRSREEAEAFVDLSGRSAQNERNAAGTNDPNYQTPSERTENATYIEEVLSSGSDARGKRGKKSGKGKK